jgi:2-methylcitrate dehydratase PrpD
VYDETYITKKNEEAFLMTTALTKELAQFCHSITFESLPKEAITRTKDLLLDCLGVTLRSSTIPSSQTMAKTASLLSSGGNSTIWGTNHYILPQYAALANGTAAHGIEMDDVTSESSLHPGVVAYPTALAIAEELNSDPKDIIAAVVAGYEVIMRLGEATLNPEGNYSLGFHSTGTCGVFGAAMISGKLLELDADQLTTALGIAGSMASGSMEYLTEGAWTKRMHPGWAAHSGILAARLAKEGYTGPQTIIEGTFGFLNAYTRKANPDKVVTDLGSPYKILETNIKIHACCRYMHASIDAALQLAREKKITPDQIKQIRVNVLRGGFDVVADPIDKKRTPANVVEAQFSVPFGIAVALVKGRAGYNEFIQQNVEDKEVRETMQKVECYIDDELDQTYPVHWQAKLWIKLHDDTEILTHIRHPRGGWPGEQISWEEIMEKFLELADPVFPKERLKDIVDKTHRLETLSSINEITRLLRPLN